MDKVPSNKRKWNDYFIKYYTLDKNLISTFRTNKLAVRLSPGNGTIKRSDEFWEISWKLKVTGGKKAVKKRTKNEQILNVSKSHSVVDQAVTPFFRPSDLSVF